MAIMALLSCLVLLLNCKLIPIFGIGPNIVMLESVALALVGFVFSILVALVGIFSFVFYAMKETLVSAFRKGSFCDCN